MATINGFGRADIRPHAGGAVSFSGYTVLSTADDGSIGPDPDAGPVPAGIYDFDTRILSHHRIVLDGQPVSLVSASAPEWSRRSITLRRELVGGTPERPRLPRDSVEISVRRRVGRGMLEEIEIANHGALGVSATLELEVDADFEELIARDGDRRHVGGIERSWDDGKCVLALRFRAEHESRTVERGLRLRVVESTVRPSGHRGGLLFAMDLDPRGRAHLRLAYESLVDDEWRSPLELGDRVDDRTERDGELDAFATARTGVVTSALRTGRRAATGASAAAVAIARVRSRR